MLTSTLTNCLSEMLFDSAIYQAAAHDQYYLKHGRTVGPLHGLPISLTDRFHVQGVDSAIGFAALLQHPKTADDEGTLVRRLRRLGAIIFVKTAVPMSLLTVETESNITGWTMNPRNRILSAGGSSGGEGALQALRGSPLGWASDVGTSLQQRAVFKID